MALPPQRSTQRAAGVVAALCALGAACHHGSPGPVVQSVTDLGALGDPAARHFDARG